jgi:hypothetical protein
MGRRGEREICDGRIGQMMGWLLPSIHDGNKVVPEAEVVDVFHHVQIATSFPELFLSCRSLSICCADENLIAVLGPWHVFLFRFFSIKHWINLSTQSIAIPQLTCFPLLVMSFYHTALSDPCDTISHVIPPICPLRTLVCRHASPYEIEMIDKESEWQRHSGNGEETHTCHTEATDAHSKDKRIAQLCPILSCKPAIARVTKMEVWGQNGPGQVCAVEFDSANAEEQEQEVAVVVFSDAVIYPSAMMIASFNTDATQGAMLASCGLLKVAGTAEAPRSKENVIVGVLSHGGCMIDGREVVGLTGDAEVGKGIGSQQDKGDR